MTQSGEVIYVCTSGFFVVHCKDDRREFIVHPHDVFNLKDLSEPVSVGQELEVDIDDKGEVLRAKLILGNTEKRH